MEEGITRSEGYESERSHRELSSVNFHALEGMPRRPNSFLGEYNSQPLIARQAALGSEMSKRFSSRY